MLLYRLPRRAKLRGGSPVTGRDLSFGNPPVSAQGRGGKISHVLRSAASLLRIYPPLIQRRFAENRCRSPCQDTKAGRATRAGGLDKSFFGSRASRYSKRPAQPHEASDMTKALSLILGLLMLVQIIYPLGLPGLRRRADAWKIAVLALALIFAAATLRPAASPDPRAVAPAPRATSSAAPWARTARKARCILNCCPEALPARRT